MTSINRRYIELYSGSRNREQFPNPACYNIPFASTRQILDPSQAIDPLTTGPIYYTWQGGNPFPSLSVPAPNPTPPPTQYPSQPGSNQGCVFLEIVGASSQYEFYIGYLLNNVTIGQTRKIRSYDPTLGKFTVDLAYTGESVGDLYTITDPSDGSTSIYIPSIDLYENPIFQYDNAYENYYIVDENLSSQLGYIVASKISFYDMYSQTATIQSAFPIGWSQTDIFTIRKTVPQEKFILDTPNTSNDGIFIAPPTSNFPGYSLPGIVMYLPLGAGDRQKDIYAGKYIYHSYNENLSPSNQANPYCNKNIFGGGIYGLFSIKSSQFNPSLNRVELLIDVNKKNGPIENIKIPNYYGGNEGSSINIVSFLKENFSPLNYNGTMVSVNESVCYDIELVSLIMPNVPLVTGSRLVFYPFVYVELANISSPSGASNDLIYSNNPPSNRALFIVPVTDTNQPISSSFMKIASPMSQNVKFKPNDSLRFRVYLPDGKQFETIKSDNLSPYPPNGRLQIEALFCIKRVPT